MSAERDRFTSTQRGYGYRWQQARLTYLDEHPLCAMHEKRNEVVAAFVVDHIVPPRMVEALASRDPAKIRAAQALFWDSNGNWQSLCKHCHDSVKQAQERSGFVSGCGADGVPIDAGHHWNLRR